MKKRKITAEVKVLTTEEKRRLIYSEVDSAAGKFFTAKFIKKDGTPRTLNGLTGVQKNLKGVGHKFDPKKDGLIGVWDLHAINKNRDNPKGDYRFINADTTNELRSRGNVYTFTKQSDGTWYTLREPA